MALCFASSLVAKLLRYTRERSRLPWGCTIIAILVVASSGSILTDDTTLYDILTPYPRGKHGSTRTTRDVSKCQHFVWKNRTYEEFRAPAEFEWSDKVNYEVLKFADVVHKTPLRRRYAVGSVASIEDPYHTFTVLEPKEKGGCQKKYFSAQRSTVQETAMRRKNGCHLAANGGYFNMNNGECLGNIISSGRIVKSTDGIANANFGIREDGSIVVGYVSEDDIRSKTNPFRQLISGVIWLVRNGTNYVNESMAIECSDNEDTGSMKTFVEVLSARSAIGHDERGRLVLVHVEGQTHVRGVNLFEFADLLIRKGVINAINLDGGGSTTFVQEDLLMNYPSDHCHFDGKYRCPREVSTVVCVHDPECLDPTCTGHGSCDKGVCLCDHPWTGAACDVLNCSLTNCSGRGNCSNGKCQCDPGWTGHMCNETCSSNHYGANCAKVCYCYGKSYCHPVRGDCICPAGLTGTGCYIGCSEGYYGPDCQYRCEYPHCSGHGQCSKLTGVCECEEGWSGESCNSTVIHSTATTLWPSDSLLTTPNISPSQYVSTDGNETSISSLKFVTMETLNAAQSNTDSLLPLAQQTTISELPCSPVSHSPTVTESSTRQQSIVAIVIITALLTILVHFVFCIFTVYCRGETGMAAIRTEARRELMERRQWERLVHIGNNRSSDSD